MCLIGNNFVFIHIPKTGGNSIKTMLIKAITTPVFTLSTILKPGHSSDPHLLLSDIPFDLSNKFKFCFVRNPWHQRVSWYRYYLRKGLMEESISFSKFLKNHHKFSISKYIQNQNMDMIYQLEEIENSSKDIESKLQIKFESIFHVADGGTYSYKDYYDNNLVEEVTNKEQYLIEKFGYQYE